MDGDVLMAERIPEEIINEIRQSVDIVDIISEYVQLKKQGRNYFGICPFHSENTPSFSVSPEKQIFHCFGCHAGGNVFSFLMDIEGISFQEAAIRLAEKANIPLELKTTSSQMRLPTETEKMMRAHELLRQFYHHILVNTNKGQEALEYLQKRNFTREIIDYFQIGYCLDEWDTSLKFLKAKGFDEDILEKAGLIIRGEKNNTYFDRFRGRIIFPISDYKGNTVAFSGRVLGNGQPKYLNSPETPIFQKSQTLFNFHNARVAIRKKQSVVLFEGFADCIAAFSAGIENGIGTMGTALTEEHIHLIKRNTDQVILCFDADMAGQNATLKAGEMLSNAGCVVRVAIIPDGKDPDEYIIKNGAELFKNVVIGGSIPFMSFKMRFFRIGKNLDNEGDRLAYIEKVLEEISKLDNAVERDIYLRQLAEEFSLSLDALKQQQRKIFYSIRRETTKDNAVKQQKLSLIKQDKKLPPAYYNAERLLIAHMLRNASFAMKVQDTLKQVPFHIDEHQAIVTYLYAFYEDGNAPDLSNFLNFIQDQHLKNIVAEIGMMTISEEISDKEFKDYIKQISNYHYKLKIEKKIEEGKKAEREKDFIKAAEILKEIIALKKSL